MKTKRYVVIRKDWSGEKPLEGSHKWPIAWRLADRLNRKAREAFKTGRIMYDVPEFSVREAP